MTDEEERSQRRQAFDLVAKARKRVNPTTTEHIAEAAKRHADPELCEYVEFMGWKDLVHRQEDDTRSYFRPNRSGHKNASGRYRSIRSILDMPERIGDLAKPLGGLSLSELRVAIAAYERRAEDNATEAGRLERIASAMESEGAATVADLGEERVLDLYTAESQSV
jgi:hypothetical protein